MAFWLLDGAQDPTFHNDPSFLNGDVFGVKRVRRSVSGMTHSRFTTLAGLQRCWCRL